MLIVCAAASDGVKCMQQVSIIRHIVRDPRAVCDHRQPHGGARGSAGRRSAAQVRRMAQLTHRTTVHVFWPHRLQVQLLACLNCKKQLVHLQAWHLIRFAASISRVQSYCARCLEYAMLRAGGQH